MSIALITNEAGIVRALENAQNCDVFYYFSSEKFLVDKYAQQTLRYVTSQSSDEHTLITDDDITIENIVNACGTISFFSEKRIVYIKHADINSMPNADIDELVEIIQNVENSKIIISGIFKDEKTAKGKKNKTLLEAMPENAITAHLKKQSLQQITQYAIDCAKKLGAVLPYTCASALIDRVGDDYFLIECEVSKLAAAVNYGEITKDIIHEMCSINVQANAFEMVNAILQNRLPLALTKLKMLEDAQTKPVAIAGALGYTYTDMYRVKCAFRKKKQYTDVYKDFNYTGSDYSLKKANDAHKKYTHKALRQILSIVCNLDKQLKSSSVDGFVVLQTALCEIDSVVKSNAK